jgi:mRNA interferase MazF
MTKKLYIPERGDVVWLDFEPQKGKEMAKIRPALTLSRKEYNKYGLAVMCPITSKVKGYPFEVEIKKEKINGAILADHVRSLDWQERNAKFICKLDEEDILKVLKLFITIIKP